MGEAASTAGVGAGSGFVRRKTVSAHNGARMRTDVSFGESGRLVLDEPVSHGGGGEGPSPLQAVLGAEQGLGCGDDLGGGWPVAGVRGRHSSLWGSITLSRFLTCDVLAWPVSCHAARLYSWISPPK